MSNTATERSLSESLNAYVKHFEIPKTPVARITSKAPTGLATPDKGKIKKHPKSMINKSS